MKNIIEEANGNVKYRYFDKNGAEIFEGDCVKDSAGRIRHVLLSTEGELGTDATNPTWVNIGKAFEGEYGIYPFTSEELANYTKVYQYKKPEILDKI